MSRSYSIDVFQKLIQNYPTWSELEQYVESEEGGRFRIADRNEQGLCLIRYEKGVSNMELPHSKWFRSVVWNTLTHRPVSVAPPKSSSEPFPYSTVEEVDQAGLIWEEWLDGFMINIFKQAEDNQLYITSRSKLDASGTFYSHKSFRRLFIESYTGWLSTPEQSLEWLIQEESRNIPSPGQGETSVGYSFLVQNKEHRIVKDILHNTTALIQKVSIFQDGRMQVEDQFSSCPIPHCTATLPPRIGVENGPVTESLAKLFQEKSWDFQGVMCKDAKGNRWHVRSEKYAAVRSLRGNGPSVLERYAALYTQNLAHLYLEYYPSEAFDFSVHGSFMQQICTQLYDHYIALHVSKTKKREEIDAMFHPHLYGIHGVYLSQLRPAHKKVTVEEIRTYFHRQPWQRISFLLRKMQDAYFALMNQMFQGT